MMMMMVMMMMLVMMMVMMVMAMTMTMMMMTVKCSTLDQQGTNYNGIKASFPASDVGLGLHKGKTQNLCTGMQSQ
eukprot:5476157-Karenia_brevis.AAC.1